MENKLLINKPNLKSWLMCTIETLFATTFWAAFIYFFLPLITTVFWLVSGQWIFPQLFSDSLSLVQTISEMLRNCLYFTCVIAVVMMGWSSWNYWCYAGLDRRKPCAIVQDSTIAKIFQVSEETILTARKAKLALVTSSPSGVTFTILKEV